MLLYIPVMQAEKLNNNAEPNHVKNAKSLVHPYELTLRDILDDAMASA